MTRARLRIGTFTPSLLIDLARSTGRLDRADLEVTEIPVPSSPAQFRSLEAGEFDVVMTSPDNVLAYRYLRVNHSGTTCRWRSSPESIAGSGCRCVSRRRSTMSRTSGIVWSGSTCRSPASRSWRSPSWSASAWALTTTRSRRWDRPSPRRGTHGGNVRGHRPQCGQRAAGGRIRMPCDEHGRGHRSLSRYGHGGAARR